MASFITRKVGGKVAIIINFVLFIIICTGTLYLIHKQNNSLENALLEKGKIQSLLGAKMVGKILEEAVDSEMLTLADVFDVNYQQIGNFDPKKFHTKYDSYLDKAIIDVEDEFLEDESNLFAVAADLNGYVPTHNTKYQQPISGDMEKDKINNRTKRIFDDPVGIKAAKTTQKGFLQRYHRDTGEEVWDVSSPIYVKGKQWGAFRIGISLETVNIAKQELRSTLIQIMGSILVISILLTFIIVNKMLQPVQTLALVADDIALGKNLESEVLKTRNDEIGELQSAIERLRMSMLIALKRNRKS